MIKISSKVLKHMGYEPYTGGAGPTEEQQKMNTVVLKKLFDRLGIQSSIETIDIENIKEEVVRCHDRYASYDRWGFCSGESDDLDQEGIEDTLNFLVGEKMFEIF